MATSDPLTQEKTESDEQMHSEEITTLNSENSSVEELESAIAASNSCLATSKL